MEEEAVTNGEEPVASWRGAYCEGTVTTILSKSRGWLVQGESATCTELRYTKE